MLRPIGARVVVEKQARQEKTDSGIIIPDTAREGGLPDIGTIVACGRFQAQELEYKGKKYLILGEQDIIAVIEE